jgi:hypothetical protein
MRKSLIAGAALFGLVLSAGLVRAEEKEYKGVLIDQKCGAKQMSKDDPEKAAAGHPKSSNLKCADSGFAVISGKEMHKFDDASADKAKEFLEKHDSTKVVVKGEEKDGKLAVSSIEEQKAEK